MLQLLFHLWGDYVFQNNWMANKKVLNTDEGWAACTIHCAIYSAPFYLIASDLAVYVIFITHFFIDKFRLARYWLMLVNWNKKMFPMEVPPYISVWILFIVDNIFHVTINYLAINYL